VWNGRIRSPGDLHRETETKFVANVGLRGSVCAGLTGRIAVSVAQVSTSSNRMEGLLFFPKIPAVAMRWESSIKGDVGNAQRFPRRLARPDEVQIHAVLVGPEVHRLACELSPDIDGDRLWSVSQRDNLVPERSPPFRH
jgi:hypothetical protein